jgi:hypothetical protein
MYKTITIDFDETLATCTTFFNDTLWVADSSSLLQPLQRVIDFVKEQYKHGAELHIVSFRHEKDKPEIKAFLKKHNIIVKTITCTQCEDKTPHLVRLKSDLHIDDDVSVLVLAKMANINTLMVDWGQETYNETAKSFKKI